MLIEPLKYDGKKIVSGNFSWNVLEKPVIIAGLSSRN